jgi:hypothetical protein
MIDTAIVRICKDVSLRRTTWTRRRTADYHWHVQTKNSSLQTSPHLLKLIFMTDYCVKLPTGSSFYTLSWTDQAPCTDTALLQEVELLMSPRTHRRYKGLDSPGEAPREKAWEL